MKKISFESVKRITEVIRLPERGTTGSAGYDFFAVEDTTIEPFHQGGKPTLVRTGIKANLGIKNNFLMLANRSSNPGKLGLVMANSIGVIDKDYYNNPDNDGEIMFSYYNVGNEPVTIEKGNKVGQGIIMNYLTTSNDNVTEERTGGFGSTGQ